jgi:succinoglycan biosynthesis transport protein ExoP
MTNHSLPPIVVPQYHNSMLFPPLKPTIDAEVEKEQGRSLRESWHILLKRKWWAIGTFLTIFLGVTLYTLLRTPIYRPVALLQITQDNPGSQVALDEKLSHLTGSDSLEKFQQTQYKILQSQSLALRVIRALNLKEYPDFKLIRENNPEQSEDVIEGLMIEKFSKRLEVSPFRNSYLVEVSYQSPDKVMARKVVNAIAHEYMNLSIDRRNESFALVRTWLDKQLTEMADKVQEAQKKLYKFGQKTDIYTLDEKDNVIVQKYVDLSVLLTKAQAEKLAKEAQFRQIKAKGPDAPLIVNNPLVASLRQQLVAEQAKVSAMRKVFRGGHPELQAEQANLAEVKSRLNAEVHRLEESVKADYEAANRTEKFLTDSFAAQKGEMARLQDNLTDYQILKRDAQTNEQLYQALLARVKEANIAGTMVPSNVTVIDPGREPNKPFKPKTPRDLALGVLLGLTMGVGLAFLVERLDDSIKSLEDLERACSLPSLGILPLIGTNGKGSVRHRKQSRALGVMRHLLRLPRRGQSAGEETEMDLIVYQDPKSQLSEAIHHIYSSLMLSSPGKPPCAIMVTSPNPSEGKSTLICNLAITYARNNRQVVLLDGDLRKPRLHQAFQFDSQPGLTNYLAGTATLEEILRPTAIPNLTVISAGARPPSPVDLLDSEEFIDLLATLRQRFRHILIDTPPVLGFADARFVSALVDGVLLVTKYQFTHKTAGRLAYQFLSQAPMLGAVLNSVGTHGQAYGGYYYNYHYKYYSKYYKDR